MGHFRDIADFLAAYPPFNKIDAEELQTLVSRITVGYIKAGQEIDVNNDEPQLRVIRTGSVEIRSSRGLLLDRLSTGGCFGYGPLLTGDRSSRRFFVLEEGLIYLINQNDFLQLRHRYPDFDYFFARETRRRAEVQSKPVSRDLDFSLGLEHVMQKTIVTALADESICQAAKRMTAERVSSILITENRKLLGIVTDRDLRIRVVAEDLDMSLPVKTIMTTNPTALSPTETVHQAYITMMSHGIHHLPVVDNEQPVGMLTLSDLIRSRNSEPLFLIKAINRAQSVDELKQLSEQFPQLIENLILADIHAHEIGRIITTLTDSLTIRLQHIAQTIYGPTPCPFCWLLFGSQGRKEQTLNSDQDNGLLLDDNATESDVQYFLKFAQFVCNGLNECGVRHCPGHIMAMNPEWCLRLKDWRKRFFRWSDEPSPKALMHASIFYDMRMLNGDSELYLSLQHDIFKRVKGQTIFLACMLENVLKTSPPLGFFKTFVLERDGDHNPVLDLKHRGTIPIVDLARLYSLSEGVQVSNTLERLQKLKELKVLHQQTADNLTDAHQFIADIRLENQQKQAAAGQKVSNNLDPKSLSPLVQHQLKDAFAVVQESQQAAKLRFGRGVL